MRQKLVYEIQVLTGATWDRSAINDLPTGATCKTLRQWKALTLDMRRVGRGVNDLRYRLVTLNPVTRGVTRMVYAPR